MAIGVKAARVSANLSQEEMAERLVKYGFKMSINTYRKLEQEPEEMSIALAKVISAITKVRLDDIFLLNSPTKLHKTEKKVESKKKGKNK